MYQEPKQPNNPSTPHSPNPNTTRDFSLSGEKLVRQSARFDVATKRDTEGTSVTIAITGGDGSGIGSITMNNLSSDVASEVETTILKSAANGDPLEMVEGFESAFIAALSNEAKVSADFARGGYEISAYLNDALTSAMQESDFVRALSVKNITKDILHISSPVKYVLTSTFLRFQEHYESSEFRDTAFTLEEFKTWFRSTRKHGQFSYYDECAGFNLPSSSLVPFINGNFDPLSSRERALLSLLPKVSGDFYVIGTYGEQGDLTHLRHEIAHGLYYTNQGYRRRVDAVLEGLDVTPIEAMLRQHGYHESVLRDECHAYLGDDLGYLTRRQIDVASYANAHEELLQIYGAFLISSAV